MEANTFTFCTLKFCIDAPIFVLIMQKMSLFGAETMILGAFQTFLCIIYHQKNLERQGFWAFLRCFLLEKYFSEKSEFFGKLIFLYKFRLGR